MRRYYVVIEHPGDGPIFMTDENGIASKFDTLGEVYDAVSGAMWEHAWAWWVVDLEDKGMVFYGTR